MPIFRIRIPIVSRIYIRGWLVVIFLGLGLLAIAANLGRTVVNAVDSYQVIAAEREGLDLLKSEYGQLQKQLDYYESYDYKKLYARDHLNLTERGERLYRINDNEQFYDVEEREQGLVGQEEYLHWWRFIFFP